MPRAILSRLMTVVMFLLATAVAPLHAQTPTEARFALVIGQDGYSEQALPTAANDAGLIADVLRDAGFDVTGIRNADHATLMQQAGAFIDRVAAAGPGAVAVVYYSGYGLQYEGENHLVPIGARLAAEADIPKETVRVNELLQGLLEQKVKARIVLLDVAYRHPFRPEGRGLVGGPALIEAPAGLLVGFNAAPGTVVAPPTSGDYGEYASALAEMMREGGLPIEDVLARVRLRVDQRTNGTAVPWFTSKLTEGIRLFDRAPDAAAADATGSAAMRSDPIAEMEALKALRAKPMKDLSEDEAYTAALAEDTVDGYRSYLEAHARTRHAKRVQAMLAARREATWWARAVADDTTRAYWTYLKTYPEGPHAEEARTRLADLQAAVEPPPVFDEVVYEDLPPPPVEEVVIVRRRRVVDFGLLDFLPPPPPPIIVLAPPAFLLPPPPRVGFGFLPIPLLPPPVAVLPPFVGRPFFPPDRVGFRPGGKGPGLIRDLGGPGRPGFAGPVGFPGRQGLIGRGPGAGFAGVGPAGRPTMIGRGSRNPQNFGGAQGFAGPRGLTGRPGPAGFQGLPSRDLGLPGPQGLTGRRAPAGFGFGGRQSPQGLTGRQGPGGFQALPSRGRGLPEPQGLTVRRGPSGFQGFGGPRGPQGLSGVSGPAGFQGSPSRNQGLLQGLSRAHPSQFGRRGLPGRPDVSGMPGVRTMPGTAQPQFRSPFQQQRILQQQQMRSGQFGMPSQPAFPQLQGAPRSSPSQHMMRQQVPSPQFQPQRVQPQFQPQRVQPPRVYQMPQFQQPPRIQQMPRIQSAPRMPQFQPAPRMPQFQPMQRVQQAPRMPQMQAPRVPQMQRMQAPPQQRRFCPPGQRC
ncbi:MAG: caspase family protein [Siculibacillus sp.]|nr:caspase family protein [Siculibacillus sp.]